MDDSEIRLKLSQLIKSKLAGSKMPSRQINVRLLPELKGQFEQYADQIGISASDLVKLLVLREKYLERLLKRRSRKRQSIPERQQRGLAEKLEKITCHLSSSDELMKFDAYAKRCSLSRNQVGVWLLEAELQEKWLAASLTRK